MPLSKKRMRERKRADRVKPKTLDVKPNDDALQSISRGIKRETDSTVPPVEGIEIVHCPICGKETHQCMCGVQPNKDDRFESVSDVSVQPIPNCPDGRYRG